MAWSVPLTAVASTALTAAQWNASVRDNLLETPAAKATTAGTHFATSAANTIAERFILDHVVETSETTTSTSYTDLATGGPTVSIVTGPKAIVWTNAQVTNSASSTSAATFEVSGATTNAANDARAILIDGGTGVSPRYGVSTLIALTAGTNVFTMKYRATGSTATFAKRRLVVMAL